MKTIHELLKAAKFDVELPNDDGWATVVTLDDIYGVLYEWLSQNRSFSKPNGPTAQELLEELEE